MENSNIHTIFDAVSGNPLGEFYCHPSKFDDTNNRLPHGEIALHGTGKIDFSLQYYDLVNTIRVRTNLEIISTNPQIKADGTETFVLSSIPVGCKITVADTDIDTPDLVYTVDDGEFGFFTAIKGKYTVKVEKIEYFTKVWEVEAV